jgi:hypothetical protein
MTLALIVLAWLALQLPLGVLLGKYIRLGMTEPAPQQDRARGADASSSEIAKQVTPLLEGNGLAMRVTVRATRD